MCGIFGLISKTKKYSSTEIMQQFDKIRSRGPDCSKCSFNYNDTYSYGFHRLCINDLSNNGNQPFENESCSMMCNGEIYNYKNLKENHEIYTKSQSDCEVILHMYHKYKNVKFISELDGVFAFSIYDRNKEKLYLGRDRIGVRPLFVRYDTDMNICFGSEAKSLTYFEFGQIVEVPPAHYVVFDLKNKTSCFVKYYTLPLHSTVKSIDYVSSKLKQLLEAAVEKRMMSDREIGCLLSGGLDSSVIASILQKKSNKPIKTFSIGFSESTDLKYARKVAEHIGSDHHEIILDYKTAISRIPEVIQQIETYDITTIRASTGMYLLSEYIKKNFNEVVIFSGEGSDELLAGYLYFHSAPGNTELFNESRRLVTELSIYDVLRADRTTAAHGLELRVPFLDSEFLQYCMSLDGSIRKPKDNFEKYYLRKAFEGYIPEEVLWRRKEGFSDGVGGLEKPWYVHIQEWITDNNVITDSQLEMFNQVFKNQFISQESLYYYIEYRKYYNHHFLPNYWLPKWQDNVNDPSGRVIPAFDETQETLNKVCQIED